MEEAMMWMLVVMTILASVALGLLNAWLLLKVVLISLMRGSAFRGRADASLGGKQPRN